MLILVIGGAGSGKSALAEALVQKLPGERIYLATMTAADPESLARICRHRRQREGLGFATLERGLNLAGAELPDGANILLEDLSNLLANERYSPEGGGTGAVWNGLEALRRRCTNLTVVSNEVFSGGSGYEAESLRYMRELAMLHRRLAKEADLVVEAVCGLPNVLKGEMP